MIWLVVLTILKNMNVNGKDDNPYIMENKKCLKPPSFPSFRAMCMLGPWSEALEARSTNWVLFGTTLASLGTSQPRAVSPGLQHLWNMVGKVALQASYQQW